MQTIKFRTARQTTSSFFPCLVWVVCSPESIRQTSFLWINFSLTTVWAHGSKKSVTVRNNLTTIFVLGCFYNKIHNNSFYFACSVVFSEPHLWFLFNKNNTTVIQQTYRDITIYHVFCIREFFCVNFSANRHTKNSDKVAHTFLWGRWMSWPLTVKSWLVSFFGISDISYPGSRCELYSQSQIEILRMRTTGPNAKT
jgi:hypothetical protein